MTTVTGDSRQPSLTGADLYHWVALRKVSDGGVTKVGKRWLCRGRRVPIFVTTALTQLCEHELVTLIDSVSGELPPLAALTDAGADLFEELCQLALGIYDVQFMAFFRRFGVDDPRPAPRSREDR